MNYPNGQSTVSDVKKNISATAAKATSELRDIKSDVKADAKSVVKSAKSVVTDIKSDINSDSDVRSAKDSVSSIANTVLSSALSLLPVRNSDEVISMLESTAKEIQSSAVTARDAAADFVRKYPLYSLLGAAAIGAGAVLLFSGRSKSESV